MNFKIIINFGRWIEDWEEEGMREEVYNYKLSRLLGVPMDESNLLLSKVENSIIIEGSMVEFSIKPFEDLGKKLDAFFKDILDSNYKSFTYKLT